MKRTLLSLLVALAAATLLASVAAAAGAPYYPMHPYFSVHIGGTSLQDADVDFDDPGIVFDDEIEFDNGFNVGAAFGYDYGLARLEVELAYRENDVDRVNSEGFAFRADGDFSATSVMLNGYWDFETGSPVVPYIGGGIGFANVSANNIKVFDVDGVESFVDDDDSVFAYQLAAGIAFDLNPALTLDLGYRFFGTSTVELDANPLLFQPAGIETEFDSHNVNLGLRMNF
jgi:opacity protein-like surface antigen